MLRLLSVLAASVVVGLVGSASAQAASPLQFTKIQYDSPGADTRSNASLDGEYVTIKNVTSTRRSLTGYTVRDAQNHVYKFGVFSLGGGKSVRLHTGKGTNTSTDRYWGSSGYIWNNSGDRAYLKNTNGAILDYCAWTSRGAGYKYC